MPDKDIKLGTAADEPQVQTGAAPDMNRYHYPPGKTEPELRPEFANESAPVVTSTTTAAIATEESDAKPLRGPLPADFPGHAALASAGLTTYAKVRKSLDTLEELDGIGTVTAEKIREAISESSEEQEEQE